MGCLGPLVPAAGGENATDANLSGARHSAVQVLQTVSVHHARYGGMRALRERQRRGLRRLTLEVSEDDLRAIAKRGYEGAVTTNHDQQAQAVGLFLTDTLLQI
jgi:hypothetical protein